MSIIVLLPRVTFSIFSLLELSSINVKPLCSHFQREIIITFLFKKKKKTNKNINNQFQNRHRMNFWSFRNVKKTLYQHKSLFVNQ